jgi:23S rRNA pseudouridine2605 synthase
MILVKYVAKSGILSRRKSEEAIKYGKVSVNNRVCEDPTYLVNQDDIIFYQKIKLIVRKPVYIMLHKPMGYLTSKFDPSNRRLVSDLLPLEMQTILDPIGRLDFNTSGLLLLTNDGDLAYSLSHPKFDIKKKYIVTASRALDDAIIQGIKRGIKLEDGVIHPDSITWNEKYPDKVSITLHSGKYRVIRRIFETLSIFVKRLERVGFSSLSLKSLPVGAWRYLDEGEVEGLKKRTQNLKK